jgi:hypothetical protein
VGLRDFALEVLKLPFWLKLHENAPKGRFKRQQSGNQSHLGRWQNKCRISQGISFDADFPVKLTLLGQTHQWCHHYHGHPNGRNQRHPGRLYI